ncbi:MAG TPA: hypothetical protein VFI15_03235 [Candidatus Limnocylindrales bacterium]|nr:hypothetical protein [Candidatus Limnocylindrales bacterium]
MTRNPRATRPASLDDDAIGLLVRDAADGWHMPPVRLDAPSWRDRVRGRRARMLDAARLGLGRAGRAATVAVALTVIGALAAVVITRPLQPAGTPAASPGESGGQSGADPTPLPKLVLHGDLPFPSHVLVANELGDIALVDLGAGTIGGSIARSQWPSVMTVTGDGLVVCICITTAAPVDGYPTRFDVRMKTFTRTTTPIRDNPVEVFVGAPDPRLPATRADHVWTSVAFSPDDRFAFVGWSTRDARVWHSGSLVVDIDGGAVVGAAQLPDMTAGDGDARRTVDAPRVLGQAADGTIYLARSWSEWGSANVETAPMRIGDDGYTTSLTNGALSDLAPFSAAASCGPSFLRAGPRPGGGLWVACMSELGSLTVRRVAIDGTSLGSESMSRTGFVDGDTTAVSPDGRTFYAWDPGSSVLTRIDLEGGERVDEHLAAPAAAVTGDDPMTAVGRWLAPTMDAKSILRGAILVSPDGGRLYLLATTPGSRADAPGGSNGILVVDAATLRVIDRWAPSADLMSMALNADGTLLYAAGLPGVGPSGAPLNDQGASVTVYDTTSGVARLLAGDLGAGTLNFPGPVVP